MYARLLEDNARLNIYWHIVRHNYENSVIVSADITDSSSTESDDEEFINTETGRGNTETEDDYHGDLNYDAWLTADEVRMCVCVMIMNGFFYIADYL